MAFVKYTAAGSPLAQPISTINLIDAISSVFTQAGFTATSNADNNTFTGTTFWGNTAPSSTVRELRLSNASLNLYIMFRACLIAANNAFALYGYLSNSGFSTVIPTQGSAVNTNDALTAGISDGTSVGNAASWTNHVRGLRSNVNLDVVLYTHSTNDRYFVLSLDHRMRSGLLPAHQACFSLARVCENVPSGLLNPLNTWSILRRQRTGTLTPFTLGAPPFERQESSTSTAPVAPGHCMRSFNYPTYSSFSTQVIHCETLGLCHSAYSLRGACLEYPNFFNQYELLAGPHRCYLISGNSVVTTDVTHNLYCGDLSSDLAFGPGGIFTTNGSRYIVTPTTEEYEVMACKPTADFNPYGVAFLARA